MNIWYHDEMDRFDSKHTMHVYYQKYGLVLIIHISLILDFIKTKAQAASNQHQRPEILQVNFFFGLLRL